MPAESFYSEIDSSRDWDAVREPPSQGCKVPDPVESIAIAIRAGNGITFDPDVIPLHVS